MRQLIKEKLQKASPAVFHFVQRSIQFFRGVIKSIDTNYLHFNLDRRSKGAPIVRSEPGFIFSFIRNSYFTFHLRPKKTSDIYSQTTDINNEFTIEQMARKCGTISNEVLTSISKRVKRIYI